MADRPAATYEDLKKMGYNISKRMLGLAGVSKYNRVKRTVTLGFKETFMEKIVEDSRGKTYAALDTGWLSSEARLSKADKKAVKRERVKARKAERNG